MQNTSCSEAELSTEKTPIVINGVTVGYVDSHKNKHVREVGASKYNCQKNRMPRHKSKSSLERKLKRKSAVENPAVVRTFVEGDEEHGPHVKIEVGDMCEGHPEVASEECYTAKVQKIHSDDTIYQITNNLTKAKPLSQTYDSRYQSGDENTIIPPNLTLADELQENELNPEIENIGENGVHVKIEMDVQYDIQSEVTLKKTSITNSEYPKQENTCFSKYDGINKNV